MTCNWDEPGVHDRGSPPPDKGADLQSRLAELSAPEPFTRWARSFDTFTACWEACTTAAWLLWAAARLAPTVQARRAVVSAATAVTRMAMTGTAGYDKRVLAALDAAESWIAGAERGDMMLAAELGALDAAASASSRAARLSAGARLLFDAAPRWRLHSVAASRTLNMRLACRAEKGHAWVALAAALTVRAAADAGDTVDRPEQWAACFSSVGTYVVRALTMAPPAWNDESHTVAIRCAAVVRAHLPCPSVA